MTENVVPAELGRLWRLPAPGDSRMGRRAVLDVDRVVAAAVQLADQEGLDGVTLPKVAERLAVTSMSLYRHVGSKGELLELMRDHASGPAPRVDDENGWRSGLTHWAVAQRVVFERHPWLAELPVSGPPAGPNAISWMEACLRHLRHTDLGWGPKLGIMSLIGNFVRASSATTHQLAAGRHGTGQDQEQVEQAYGRALAELVDPSVYPETAALFRSRIFEPAEPPAGSATDAAVAEFRFGLELILDGIAAVVER